MPTTFVFRTSALATCEKAVAREPTRTRLYGAPPFGTLIFVGRDSDKAELIEKLKANDVRLCASIEGLAGIG